MKLSVDSFISVLRKRIVIPLVLMATLGAWLILCQAHYKSYWQGTIFRVQTTDFNLLRHSLPQTLSRMIVEGRSDLVQKALDSTYGLFGLVVTDPSGSTVLWKTGKIYKRESWHKRATVEGLVDTEEPYDLLLSPVSLEPMYSYSSPRAVKARQLREKKDGEMVLGRLYYLRADPPSFAADLRSFLTTGVFEMSGAKRGYFYITVTCISFALVLVLVIWLRQRGLELKQKELDLVQRDLEIRRKALESLSSELAAQRARKVWLEKEADIAYKRAVRLKQSMEKLKDSLMRGMPSAVYPLAQEQATRIESPGLLNRNAAQGSLPVSQSSGRPQVRPAAHPPSSILEEIESLLPGLAENASVLKHQAGFLHEYCTTLEERQEEMQRIVSNAYRQSVELSRVPGMRRPSSSVGNSEGLSNEEQSAGNSAMISYGKGQASEVIESRSSRIGPG